MKNFSIFSKGSIVRHPEIGSLMSLFLVIFFYVVFGHVELDKFISAASWVNFAANLGIVAFPVGLLMITGELDISIGAMIPAGSMTVAILSGYFGYPITVGIIGALLFGVMVGLFNGFVATRTSVPSLIITLASLVTVQGIVLAGSVLITGDASVVLNAPEWAKTIFGNLIAGKYQVIILWWLGLFIVYVWFLRISPWGNWIFAIGGDVVSARNAGIPTDKVKIGLFVLSSVSASFVGMCSAIVFNSAQVSGGMSYIFNTIVSIVVGGVLLTGGFGTMIGVFLGTLIFAIVNQGIYFTDIDRNWSNLIIAILLIGAVFANNIFRKMAFSQSTTKKN